MRMYLMRHGETEWNRLLKLQGRSDIPLNDNGIAMAKNAAKGLLDVDFSVIYSSPLTRALQTAEIIRGAGNIDIIKDDRIIEIGFGENEGRKYDKTKPEEYPDLIKFFTEPDIYVPANGGETIENLKERTANFVKYIAKTYGATDDNILVTTHGATIRGIMSYIKGTSLRDFWRGGVQSNCGVTIIEITDESITIISENITF
ncbi:MAG: histidine phosphatase family protein [Lachnospiraceae bacterium]|nr:histidine phosphatase family protein [Lachnospiraceae bacterium]